MAVSRKLFWNLSLLLLAGILFATSSNMVQAAEAEFDQSTVRAGSIAVACCNTVV